MPVARLFLVWLMSGVLVASLPLETALAQNFWELDEPKKKPKPKPRPRPVAKPAPQTPAEPAKEAAAEARPGGATAPAATAASPAAAPAAAATAASTAAAPDSQQNTPTANETSKPESAGSTSTAPVEAPKADASATSAPTAAAPAAADSSAAAASAAEDARNAAKEARGAAAAIQGLDSEADGAVTKKDDSKPKELVAPAASKPDASAVVAAAFKKLDDKDFIAKAHKDDVLAAKVFYGEKSGDGIWIGSEGFHAKGKAAIEEIRKAEDWGLDAKDFDIPVVASGQAQPDALGEAEARLTLTALKYARFARGGRVNPMSLSRIWDQQAPLKEPIDVINALASSNEPDAYLRDLHPKHDQFKRLREALLKARGPAQPEEPADPALQVKLPKGQSLKPGAEHADVALLRQRLKVPAEAGAKELVYDDKLVETVKAYQKEKGLKGDGWLNAATRTALNAEGEAKKPNPTRDIQRILINMERWRWMPEDMGAFHVWNNAPEFTVRVVKDGNVVLKDKIIVGQPSWPTPVFSADMLYIIFNPEWGMPNGIKMKELLPRMRSSGGGFFESLFGGGGGSVIRAYGLKVYYGGRQIDPDSVNWSTANIANYSFIQPAGPKNPLGVVKFRFPNKHDVYMHDTPERELFARSYRALSHGCIRVNNPTKFAQLLLDHDRAGGGQRGDATLKTPIPVHISYFTAIVDDDGRVQTFGDMYGHDSRLSAALGGKPLPYEAPPIETSSTETVATTAGDATAASGSANKKRKKKDADSVQELINNVFLN